MMRSLAVLFAAASAFAAPQVFWASDPIRPGETVLVRGAGFGERPSVAVARLADGAAGAPAKLAWPEGAKAAKVVQPSDVSLKFAVPGDLANGVLAYRVTARGESVSGLLNQPALWWAQGDRGPAATPGGWLRLFGKNLAWGAGTTVTVAFDGRQRDTLRAEGDAYGVKLAVPGDLPPGDHQLRLHSGLGGAAAWSEPLRVQIVAPDPWPATIFNVKDYGADGTGLRDDTAAIRAALAQAKAAGGGVVYFPRGRYQATDTLYIPPRTVLRGENEALACVFWPDVEKPPSAWIVGTYQFGIEQLSFYCSNYDRFLTANTSGPNAGDVFLRHVRVRANVYRGHITPEEVDKRWRQGLKVGFGGGYWLLVLGGRNIAISDCDLYSSSCTYSLTEPRGARIERNILGSGRWGGGGVFGGDGVIIEGNRFVGCDLQSWGAAGGLGFGNLEHVLLARNTFALQHGGDREPITSDASGEVYSGPLAGADADGITLPKPPKDTGSRWLGAAVYVLSGKGEGQWRKLAGFDGARLKVDRPWDVVPDATSVVAVTWLLRQWLLLDNEFTDTGMAIQLYGNALEHICAGNRSTRTAGFHNFGMNYAGAEPSWYVQWFDNEILEGNLYSADHDNHRLTGDAHLGTYGLIGPNWKVPIVLGTIMRRNRLHNNASIVLGTELPNGKVTPGTRTDPLVCDSVVENNLVEHSDVGIYLFQTTRGTCLVGNRFEDVKLPLWDEVRVLEGEAARRQKILSSRGPIADWKWSQAVVDATGLVRRVPDAAGNGFDAEGSGVRVADDGRGGKAGVFDGKAYLRVDEPAYFNLQSLTLGLWVKPERVAGRNALIGKRYTGTAAPYVLTFWDGAVHFEGNAEDGKWSFNFRTSGVLKAAEWAHVAAVVEEGKGVTVFLNGRPVGTLDNPLKHTFNGEPLMIGREAWGGIQMQQDPPAFFKGLMGEVKVWARPLSAAEVQAEATR